jgi:hypothetical protein
MLHELLAKDPVHFLWKKAPLHILNMASDLMSRQGDFDANFELEQK